MRIKDQLFGLTAVIGLAIAGCGDDGTSSAGATDTDTGTAGSTSASTTAATEGTAATTTQGSGSESMSAGTTVDPTATTTTTTTTATTATTATSGPETTAGTTDATTDATTGLMTDATTGDMTTGDATTGDVTTGDLPCEGDGQCLDPDLPVCDLETGECVACTPDNDPCPLGSYCSDADLCVDGCLGSGDCPVDNYCDVDSMACVATAESCLQLLGWGYDKDGDYLIDPDGGGPIPAFTTFCDQTTDGGGWTEITLDIACTPLSAALTAVAVAPIAGVDGMCRPYTRDAAGDHTYHYTIPFPPGFGEFYLQDYKARANGSDANNTSDIQPANFKQTLWTVANKAGGTGDISFGSADEAGPSTSYAAQLVNNFDCWDCELDWPPGAMIFTVLADSKALRIGWGEAGSQAEGWFPWWAGTIRIR
jgi:hypothetical protein